MENYQLDILDSNINNNHNDDDGDVAADVVDDHTTNGQKDFELSNNDDSSPFAFSTSLFIQLIDGKKLPLLIKCGGTDGLLRGLHTDAELGLSNDETASLKPITLKDITNKSQKKDKSVAVYPAATSSIIPDESAKGATNDTSNLERLKSSSSATSTIKEGTPFWQRKKVYSVNSLPEKPPKSLLQYMWMAIHDKILILLSIAAVVSLGLGLYEDFGVPTQQSEPKIKWVEGVAIIVAILIVVVVGSINDWQKEKQFQKLNAKKEERDVKVTRNGKEILLSVHNILVGDILHLEPGDIIPVDGVLILGYNVRCDEFAITGESDAVRKLKYDDCLRELESEEEQVTTNHDPFLVSGSKVLEGVGKYVVVAVGENSFYGRIMLSVREKQENTPLQEKLNDLAEKIAKLGGAAALLMLIVLMIKYFVNFRNGVPAATQAIEDLLQIIISTITVVVVAVPEGLPLAVTLALAYATLRMLKDNNLVRVLAACETMGNATTICSDKTGTLTQNKMTVVSGTIGITTAFVRDLERFHAKTKTQRRSTIDSSLILENTIAMSELRRSIPKTVIDIFDQSISINSTAFEGDPDAKGKPTFIGSKTETALLGFLIDLGISDYKEVRRSANVVQIFPFSSDRKAVGVVVKISESKWRFYVEGASEVLASKAGSVVNIEASEYELQETRLTTEHLSTIQRIIVNYASQSLRTIAFAYRDFEQWPPEGMSTNDVAFEELAENVTLFGIVGIEDPLREGVEDAVCDCRDAGIFVRMVTGDNIITAKSIAKQCGIYTNGIVMEGPAFRNLSPQKMDEIVPRLQILARSSPEDKRILVAKLKELGEIVAVTGDGINDGPALRTADVGFSMGITGTEVAKEASSIILMDDNFSSLVKAIMWGRCVNDSIKKFLQFQLTVNITAVLLTFISAISNDQEKSVLTAVQLLWVNLIMDTFAALALATDPPNKDLLDRSPERRTAPLISTSMWKMIIGQSIFQLAITLVLLYAGNDILNYDTSEKQAKLETLIFNTFVFLQIFNEINCRRLDHKLNVLKGLTKNTFFMIIFLITLGGQIVIVQLGSTAFQVQALDGVQWAISIALGFLSIPVGVIIRLLPNELFDQFRSNTSSGSRMTFPPPITPQTPAGDKQVWNSAITNVQEDLIVFKSLRGGRTSLYFDKRGKDVSRSAFAAATMVPSLVAGSVGAGWAPTMRNQAQSRPISLNPSASQLDLSSQWFNTHQQSYGIGVFSSSPSSLSYAAINESNTAETSASARRARDSTVGEGSGTPTKYSTFYANESSESHDRSH